MKEKKYFNLYCDIKNKIISGEFAACEKLPSKRVMADMSGCSLITVERAYSMLSDEGYILPRERSGYFVNKINAFDAIAIPKDSVTLNYLDLPVSSKDKHDFEYSLWFKTIRKVISEYGELLFIKSPNKGCAILRNAIADYLYRYRGMIAQPEQIIIGSGAEYLYSLVVQMLGRDKIYAIEDPSYEKIRKVYKANGVSCDMLKMGSDGIKSSALEKTKAGVLHVTPFNSFPSGVTATASKRNEYIRWAKNRNGYLVEDDFDSEFTVSMKTADTLFALEPDRTIYMNTFSKTVAPSLRVGYMVLPESLKQSFEETVGFYACTVPVLDQFILAELIENGDFERHINRVRRKRRNNK